MEKNTLTTNPSLKDLIKQSDYNQTTLAKALGIDYSTVKAYVAGAYLPGVKIFADMCRLLDKSPKEVMSALGIDVTGIPDDQPIDS
ncbi:MAG: helix-turn-helix transcriptional regulator [Crocosphaera sp.]